MAINWLVGGGAAPRRALRLYLLLLHPIRPPPPRHDTTHTKHTHPQARQVLMMGFAAQVYNQVPCSKMRARLAQRLYDVCPEVSLDKGYRYLSV